MPQPHIQMIAMSLIGTNYIEAFDQCIKMGIRARVMRPYDDSIATATGTIRNDRLNFKLDGDIVKDIEIG